MNWVKGVDSGGRYFTGFILVEVDWEGTAQIHITSCTVEDAVGKKVLMNKATFKGVWKRRNPSNNRAPRRTN